MDPALEWVRAGILLVADVLGWILAAIWTAIGLIAYAVWTAIAFLGKWAWWGIVEFLTILERLTAGTWFGWYVFELHMSVPIFTTVFAFMLVFTFVSEWRKLDAEERDAKRHAEMIDHNLLRAKTIAARLTKLPLGDKHLNYVISLYDWRAIEHFLTAYDNMGEDVFVERLDVSTLGDIERCLDACQENVNEESELGEYGPQEDAQGFEIPTSVRVAGGAASAYGGYKMGRKLADWLTK